MTLVKMADDKMADDRNVIGEKPLIEQSEKIALSAEEHFQLIKIVSSLSNKFFHKKCKCEQ